MPHGLVNHQTACKHVGSVAAASAVRVCQCKDRFKEQLHLDRLSQIFKDTGEIRQLPKVLEIWERSWLRELTKMQDSGERRVSANQWASLIAIVVYRCDDHSAFPTYHEAMRRHNVTKRQRDSGLRKYRRKVSFSENYVFARAAKDHFKDLADDHTVCSTPVAEKLNSPSLRQALTSDIARPEPDHNFTVYGDSEVATSHAPVGPHERTFFKIIRQNNNGA